VANEIDTSAEYSRILQLLKQFNLYGQSDLIIVFGSITKDAEYSTWSTPDGDFNKHQESGFFNLMQHLLSAFVEYKSQGILLEHCHGIIQIKQCDIAIEWVSKKVADDLCATIREKDNVN
jgi:hypothetical protein